MHTEIDGGHHCAVTVTTVLTRIYSEQWIRPSTSVRRHSNDMELLMAALLTSWMRRRIMANMEYFPLPKKQTATACLCCYSLTGWTTDQLQQCHNTINGQHGICIWTAPFSHFRTNFKLIVSEVTTYGRIKIYILLLLIMLLLHQSYPLTSGVMPLLAAVSISPN